MREDFKHTESALIGYQCSQVERRAAQTLFHLLLCSLIYCLPSVIEIYALIRLSMLDTIIALMSLGSFDLISITAWFLYIFRQCSSEESFY